MADQVRFIYTDPSSNRNYYVYETVSDGLSIDDFIKIAERENFNFDGRKNVIPWDAVQRLFAAKNTDNVSYLEKALWLSDTHSGVSAANVIFNAELKKYSSNASPRDDYVVPTENIYRFNVSTSGLSGQSEAVGLFYTVDPATEYSSEIINDKYTSSDLTNRYFIFHTSHSDNDLLQRQYNEIYHYSHQATNQNIAFRHILTFFVLVTVVNFLLDYQNVNLAQLLIIIAFFIYLLFNKKISVAFIEIFKNSINSIKNADTSTQVTTYLQLFFVTTLLFAFPISIFLITSQDFEFPSFTETLTDTTVKDTLDSASDVGYERGNEVFEKASEQASAASDTVAEYTDVGMKQASNIRDQLKNAVQS